MNIMRFLKTRRKTRVSYSDVIIYSRSHIHTARLWEWYSFLEYEGKMYLTMLSLPLWLISIESLIWMYVICGGGQDIIFHVPFHIMDHLCMLLSCFWDPELDRKVMHSWILKQNELLHEVLEKWYPRVVCLIHVSPCVSKIYNSKFQVLKPLEDTSRTELKFLLVELPKVHIPLKLFEHCL